MKYEVHNIILREPASINGIDVPSIIVESTAFGRAYFAAGLLIAKFKPLSKKITTYVPNTVAFDVNESFGIKDYVVAKKINVSGESLLNLDNQLKLLEHSYASFAPYFDNYKALVHEHFDYHQTKEEWVISLPDCELGTQFPINTLSNIIDITTIFDKH